MLGGLLVHPRDRAVELLQFYRDFTQSAPDELGAYAALLHTPDGAPVAAIVTCYCGDLVRRRAGCSRRCASSGRRSSTRSSRCRSRRCRRCSTRAVPDGNQNYWKSTFLRELSDDAIRRDGAPRQRGDVAAVGGRSSSSTAAPRAGSPPTDTAFAQRHAQYDLGILAQWTRPEESERHVAWARAFADDMSAYRSGDYLLNFLGEGEDDAIKAAFGPNYLRLVEVKTKYDPTNFFRVNQNIQPAAVAAG